jgi:type IV fimbrial biogenesis protein FimT
MLMGSTRTASRGFTLIELAVVMVLLGLALMASMPSINSWMRNTQVRNTASSMLAGLAHARNEAIRRNVPIRFSLVSLTDAKVMNNTCAVSNTGVSWVVSARDPSGRCGYAPSTDPATDATDANNPLIVESSAGGIGGGNVVIGARLEDGTAAGGTLTFNGFGRIADPAPMRVIEIDNDVLGGDFRRLRIEIAPGGSSRLCDMGVTDNTDSRSCATRLSIP